MAYSFIDLACEALKSAKRPLTSHQIWENAVDSGIVLKIKTKGKTPYNTLVPRNICF